LRTAPMLQLILFRLHGPLWPSVATIVALSCVMSYCAARGSR